MEITSFGVAIIETDSHLSKWLVEHGRLDIARDQLVHFKHLIPEGGVVVDLGACLGDHTATYSEFVGPTGVVYAFEPNPPAFECLRHNMQKYPNVMCFPLACGREPGRCSIETSTNLGMARVNPKGTGILVTTLDEMFPRTGARKVAFIKMDIEGFEPDAIAGATALLKRDRPALLIEVNRPVLTARNLTPEDIYRPLRELGYSIAVADPNATFEMDQIDIICIPTPRL